MYAQKIEGESWMGERLDGGKIDKMSGMFLGSMLLPQSMTVGANTLVRSAARSAVRAHASYTEQETRGRW